MQELEKFSKRKAFSLTLALCVSSAALILTYNRMLPTADGLVGHDYSYFLPYLLTGLNWIHLNGWSSIPYFTPDFCGGIPWLPNPQSLYYSVPQALSLVTDFVSAIKFSAIGFTFIGSTATYALLRQCFGTSWQAAILGFVLFQLNGFLIFRIGVGHLTYHAFGLVPVLAWCVLYFSAAGTSGRLGGNARIVCGSIIVGCTLAVMVHAGAVNFIIPALLSVAAVILLQQIRRGGAWSPWIIMGVGCLWSIPLSAVKLFPAYIFSSAYPRSYLSNALFDSPLRQLNTLLRGLFVPELLPPATTMREEGFTFGQHEFELGISVIPLALFAAVIVSRTLEPPHRRGLLGVLLLLMFVPILLTVGPEAWGRFLLHVPVINNSTVLVRWYSAYILPIITLAALSFDIVLSRSRAAEVAMLASVCIAALQLVGRDLTYYTTPAYFPLYDPAPVLDSAAQIAAGGSLPPITELQGPVSPIQRNDGLVSGRSPLACYEPIFGYDLEIFPARELRAGSITERVAEGRINLADPRCYIDSKCPAGSLFRTEDISAAVGFASHTPLAWHHPTMQRIAEVLTGTTMALSAVALFGLASVSLKRPRRRRQQS